ncbi:MAG: protein-export chaperone SecB [Thiogranum sp.]|jgi:preprotein translocase subunit SecB|nr:protein-export chaperone SecB [Thiogranum sp.]
MTEDNPQAASGEATQFNILRVYLKDVSFEAPNSPTIFVQEFKPQVDVEVTTSARRLDDNIYEVVLQISASAKHEETTGFLVELEQAGIFHIQGYSSEQMEPVLGSACPKALFPFAREAVSDLVTKGGFPQLLLAPVSFDQLQQQKSAAEKKRVASE